MSIPKLKRDITNTKIINKDEVINYINSSNEIDELNRYLNLLLEQNKVDKSEVIDIINCLKNKLNVSNNFDIEYNNVKDDFDKLNEFYESNLFYVENCMKNINDVKCSRVVVNFMQYAINREKEYIQNKKEVQELFDYFINYYKDNRDKFSLDMQNVMDKIILDKESLLNRVSNDDDYIENDYLSRTQVLSLGPSKKGYNLTDDDLKLNSKAFIATTIVLEASLALGLIIALMFIFNR